MTELEQYRAEIDRIDKALAALWEERMAVTRQVGLYKKAHGLPVLDAGREAALLEDRKAFVADPALREDVTELFGTILALSRRQQARLISEETKPGGG